MAYKSDPRGSRPVRLVAVHTAEGSRTAASLGSYFYNPSVQASSHVGIDAGATLQYVGYDRSAWTLRSGNPISDNAELCGFAKWTREQWLSTATADGCASPRAILDRTAAWIRSRCLARGIPIRKLTAAQVAAGMSGVVGHIDWTNGMHDGTHTDPGGGFPSDYVINLAAGGGGGGSAPAAPATTVATTEEHLVQLRAGNRSASISCKGAKEMVISSAYGDLKINQCVFWGGYGKAGDDNWKGEFAPSGGKVTDHYPWVLKVPDGALSCSLWWELADDNHEASLQVIF